MKSNFRNCGVRTGEKWIARVAAKRDDYRYTPWQSNSLYHYHYSAVVTLEPFSWSKTLLVSTVLFQGCSLFHYRKTCCHRCVFSGALLLWKGETVLWYSTGGVRLGVLGQLPLVCWILPTGVCAGLSNSAAGGEGKDIPRGSWAARGRGFSVQ